MTGTDHDTCVKGINGKRYFTAEREKKTILSVLVEDPTKLNPYKLNVPGNHNPPNVSDLVQTIHKTKTSGLLDIIPSTLDLMYVALGQPNKTTAPMEERFDKFIAEAKKSYDLIIIDCHPAGSIFTKTSLSNSDSVLIPVIPQKYALRGIGLMLSFISQKSITSNPEAMVLFNSVPRVDILSQERDIRRDKSVGKLCLRNTLKYYKAFGDPEEGANFVWNSKKPWSGAAFRNLESVSREIIGRVL